MVNIPVQGNREIGFVPSLHFTAVDSLLGMRMLHTQRKAQWGPACSALHSEGISQVATQGSTALLAIGEVSLSLLRN